jgi:nucleotide-binding universal stress UspA family protein
VRLVVPLDGSDLALAALPLAPRLAAPSGGEVILVAVVDPDDERLHPTAGDPHPLSWRATQRHLHGVALGLRGDGLRAHSVVLTATDVAEAIAAQAVAERADLIVMSTHGRGGLGRWVYGSVADRVAHVARTPVLLVRPSPAVRDRPAPAATAVPGAPRPAAIRR